MPPPPLHSPRRPPSPPPPSHISALVPFAAGLHGVNQSQNFLFLYTTLLTFLSLLLLTLFYRLFHSVNLYLRLSQTVAHSHEQVAFWSHNSNHWIPWLKKHLIYSPLFRNRHNREFRLSSKSRYYSISTLPSRYHSLLLALFFFSNLAYCLVLPWSKFPSQAVVAALRGRTGVLATLNLIPTFLFAFRNNPLIPLLRVSYDTMNLLHRWSARILILHSTLHAICWLANSLSVSQITSVPSILAREPSYQWGLVASTLFIFVLFQSPGPIRHAFYDSFLFLHRFAVLIALIGIYIHLDTHNLPLLYCVQLSAALWLLEYLFRFISIYRYNVSLARAQTTQVLVEALSAEACRVTFTLVSPLSAAPGSHVHVYFPAISYWSSHPFSIAWLDHNANSGVDSHSHVTSTDNASIACSTTNPSHAYLMKEMAASTTSHTATNRPDISPPESPPLPSLSGRSPNSSSTVAHSSAILSTDPPATRVHLIVRARTGLTRKLYTLAMSSPSRCFTTRGALEGPYGGQDRLSSYGTVILLAGGVGITHQLPHARHLLRGYDAGVVSTHKIILVWTVPELECLEWVKSWMSEILAMPHRKRVLRVELYVTRPKRNRVVVSRSGSVQMFPGRCNVARLLDQALATRVGATVVSVCGPGSLADTVRCEVRKRVHIAMLDFIEESFSY